MDTAYCIVYCTCPNLATAVQIAQELTTAQLVACTNIIPDITSIYSWEGNLVQGTEAMMVIKTRNLLLLSASISHFFVRIPDFRLT